MGSNKVNVQPVTAPSSHCGEGINTMAEVKAFLDGLILCWKLQFRDVKLGFIEESVRHGVQERHGI